VRVSNYILCICAVVLTACQFKDREFVDFLDLEAAANMPFKPFSQHETDLSHGLPYNCYLPDGTSVNDYRETPEVSDQDSAQANGPRRTNSVTGTAVVQELLRFGEQNKVLEIVGTYPSIDTNGDTILLSGKVMLPAGKRPKRMILVSHYTVCSNAEAPSNSFAFEGLLVKQGYGLIIPDYIGYGVTANMIHPYLVMDLTARNVLDMYFAVKPWLEAVGRAPEHKEINLMGYSQGGATTMAVQYLIENEYWDEDDPRHVKIHRVFAGGGPYDVQATYEGFVTTDVAGYPVAVPLVLQGMILGNNLNIQMSDMMQPWLCEHMDDWINSKKYTSSQINTLIGTTVTHKLLTQEAMDQRSDKVAELYKAMTINSIVSYIWSPFAPVYMMHSMDDQTVPYTNASHAKSKWGDANITYNFGHYGNHVKTCLRFIYSVQTLLKQEAKEEREKDE